MEELTVAQKRFVDLEGSLSVNQYNNNKYYNLSHKAIVERNIYREII